MIKVVLNNNASFELPLTMKEFIDEIKDAKSKGYNTFYLHDGDTNEITFAFRIDSISYFRPLDLSEEREEIK